MAVNPDSDTINVGKVKVTNISGRRLCIAEINVDFASQSSVFISRDIAENELIKRLYADGIIEIADIDTADYLLPADMANGKTTNGARAHIWMPANTQSKLPKTAALPPHVKK